MLFTTFIPQWERGRYKGLWIIYWQKGNGQSRRLVDVLTTICPLPLQDWVFADQLSQLQPSLLVRSHIRWSFPQSDLIPLQVMSRLVLDFGSSSYPTLMKTFSFDYKQACLLPRILGGGAKNVGERNSGDCKYVRSDQENSAREIWRHEPHHSSPPTFPREPSSGKICHARRV